MAMEATDELSALAAAKRAAFDAGRADAVTKQHALGKLTARERLDLLIDRGTFLECGILSGSPVSLPKPTRDPDDRRDPALAKILPDNPRHAYNMRDLIAMIVDDGYCFELKAEYAQNVITAFARMGGQSI